MVKKLEGEGPHKLTNSHSRPIRPGGAHKPLPTQGDLEAQLKPSSKPSGSQVKPQQPPSGHSKPSDNGQSAPQHKPQISSSHSTGAKPAVTSSSARPQTVAKPTASGSQKSETANPGAANTHLGRLAFEIIHNQMPGTKDAKQQPRKKNTRSAPKAKAPKAKAQGPPKEKGMSEFFAPVSQGTVITSTKPSITRNGFGETRIVHREKIAKLTTPGTGVFTILATVPLNPGLTQAFPWLCNESQGWEYYRFNRVRFMWIPTNSTATDGNVIMGPDYDSSEAAPVGETALSSFEGTREANLWMPFAAELKSKEGLNAQMPRKLVRHGAIPSNTDIKMYDSGNFFVAVADDTAAKTGKLWVEYDVTLYTPQVPSGGFQAAGTLLSAGGSIAAATPFGAAPLNTGALVLTAAATNVVTIVGVQVGSEILISAWVQGTTISASSIATVSGLTAVNAGSVFNAAATSAMAFGTFTVTSGTLVTATLTLTAAAVSSTYYCVTVLAPKPTF